MPMENAKEFLAKVKEGDAAVLGIIDGVVPEGAAEQEGFDLIAKAAAAAGWDFTAAELADASVLAQELSDDELEAVAGGDSGVELGGCTSNYYRQKCGSSVRADSWCWSDDLCILTANTYQKPGQVGPFTA